MVVHPKVISAAVVSALVGLLLWLLKSYAHVDIPVEQVAAINTLAVFVAGYFTPSELLSK